MKTITWGQIRPRILAEMDGIRTALTIAAPERVPVLQARYFALDTIFTWAESERFDEPIFDEHV